MNVQKLIEEVLTDLGNNVSLSAISSKVQIISRIIKNDEFASWVSKEFLVGYSNVDNLPSYRISFAADIKANYLIPHGFGVMQITGQSVPIMNLGLETYNKVMTVRLFDAIPTIQDYAYKTEKLSMSLSPYELAKVQKVLSGAQIIQAHKELSPSSFLTPIETVKAKLIDMFIDFDERLFDNTIDFNAINKKKDISEIVNNYISPILVNSGNGIISVNGSDSISSNSVINKSEDIEKINNVLNKMAILMDNMTIENTEIAEQLSFLRNEIANEKPEKNIIKKGLEKIMAIAKIAAISGIEELAIEGIQALNIFS